MIQKAITLPEVKQRLGRRGDGFIPDLSRWFSLPRAYAAQTATKAGILNQSERTAGTSVNSLSEKEFIRWEGRMGLSVNPSDIKVGIVYLSQAAFDEKFPLLPTARYLLRRPQVVVGVEMPSDAFVSLVEEERQKLGPGQTLIAEKDLSKIVNAMIALKVNEVRFVQSMEDVVPADLIRKLKEQGIRVEKTPSIESSLEWTRINAPGIAEEIALFARAIEKALRTAA